MSTEWTPPAALDEYRLVRQLGRGGMGQVWLATDELLDRSVAIKLVDDIDPNSDQRRRFLVEARAAARLSHPNVVAIHRVGELRGIPYIVTELIRGQSLDKLPRPLPERQVVEIGIGLARGLAAAHHSGVLHRDLKPGNAILGDDGVVKILDFGLAKLDSADDFPRGTEPPAPIANPAAPAPESSSWVPAPVERTVSFMLTPRDAPNALAVAAATPAELRAAPLTRRGAIMGTPYYMAPETWRGEAHTRGTDLYSLGALLFELACGAPPFADVEQAALPYAVTHRSAPALLTRAPGVDPRLAALIDRCLALEATARFGSAGELGAALEALIAPSATPVVAPTGNPYRGLARFESEHAALFFGRRADTSAVLDRLRSGRFVLVTGDSGVGKSSLIRAGVLPALAAGVLGDRKRWRCAICVPGRRPRLAVAEALATATGGEVGAFTEALGEPGGVARAVNAVAGRAQVAILIDQLEELVTRAEPEEAAVVARWIAEVAAAAGPVLVIATARGDQLTRLARLPGLADELARALHMVTPLDADGLRDAIVGPAEAAGLRFDPPEVVDDLVAAGRADGGLPLLEFALAALWDARDVEAGVISRAALDALGGVEGALARHADRVVAALAVPERAEARRILLALVAAEGVSSGRTDAELCDRRDPAARASARAALDALIASRLVVARATAEGTIHDVAHERLIGGWPTLRGWLDEGVGRRVLRERLVRAAAEWQHLGGRDAGLWPDRRLDELAALPTDELGPTERRFVARSRRARGRRRAALVLALLAVPVLAAAIWAWSRYQAHGAMDAKVDRRVVEAHAAIEQARTAAAALETKRLAAFARFDAGDDERAEVAWAQVIAEAANVDQLWRRAAQSVEPALLIDGSRTDARRLLAEVLYERALVAERDHDEAELAELAARFALYDVGGTRAAAWNQLGEVALTVTPADAEVSVERFIDGQPARWQAMIGPWSAGPLEPGSYRFRARAPGRVEAILPFLVARGSRQQLTLTLPPAGAVPPGFVYVPAGPYLAGVSTDETQRKDFFKNAPLHPSATGAYLIEKTETTWRSWIAYLDALPPAERAARTPRSTTVGGQGEIALARDGTAWVLRLALSGHVLTARAGEPLVYPGRTRRQIQDWLELPVTGVNALDARAYAAWRASRGLAGARLCAGAEWERAARGADGRMFPGGQHLGPDDANHQDTYGTDPAARGPDEVGSYPTSDSPFGVQDLAGNVFELVGDAASGAQYVRGGAYAFAGIASRTELRERFELEMRDITIGFRMCADVANIE